MKYFIQIIVWEWESSGTMLDSESQCGNCQTVIASCGTVPDSDSKLWDSARQ